ncbi:MAG: SAM-dependent methyltransferase [Spirochaetota bacterium]
MPSCRRRTADRKGRTIATTRSTVGRYYDRNTRRFLLAGHGGRRLAIRRAVWGPGISDRDDAIDYVNSLVLGELRSLPIPSGREARVLDLGCGVGGGMLYLAPRFPATYHGVTISRVQAELGRRFIEERRVSSIEIHEADLTDRAYWEREAAAPFDLAYAVESFIHVDRVLSELPLLAGQLRPGGRLIVVDDMISRSGARRWPARRERRWLNEFKRGWYARGLASVEQFVAAGREAGLRLLEARDLTPYLELDRPRDRAAGILVSALRWLPLRPEWFNNLLGGNALQRALKRGLLGYYYLVFSADDGRTA